ncbi:MAG TPA: redoxin domain-containing protein [Candidatus Eisenbacteria bacterium]|nr:redoxin domain-containing protein [Candidatus Eisenbacteria bacterium]
MTTTSSGPQARPRLGELAPDFTLTSTTGGQVTLSSWRGKNNVLLAFFPLAFTSVCSKEMCEIYENIDRFRSASTQVFGISVDSIPTLKEWQYKNGMQTELLSDFKREVSRRYGVLDEDKYYSTRSYFLIDMQGILRWSHIESDNANKRDLSELLDPISKLT